MLILVRHAMPATDPDTDPADWQLSPDGLTAARGIAGSVPDDGVLVSSDEPKAYDTLRAAAGRPVLRDERLREVRRPREPFADDFRVARLAYVAGRPPAGWEAPEQVAARIDAVVAERRVEGRALVLAGHGMAFTTWLAARGLVSCPETFWTELRLPDVLAVADATVRRLG